LDKLFTYKVFKNSRPEQALSMNGKSAVFKGLYYLAPDEKGPPAFPFYL
jgi:hypothetical protein